MLRVLLIVVCSKLLLWVCLLLLAILVLIIIEASSCAHHLGRTSVRCSLAIVRLLLLLPVGVALLECLLALQLGQVLLLELTLVDLSPTDEVSAVNDIDREVTRLESFFQSLNFFEVSWLQQLGLLEKLKMAS